MLLSEMFGVLSQIFGISESDIWCLGMRYLLSLSQMFSVSEFDTWPSESDMLCL